MSPKVSFSDSGSDSRPNTPDRDSTSPDVQSDNEDSDSSAADEARPFAPPIPNRRRDPSFFFLVGLLAVSVLLNIYAFTTPLECPMSFAKYLSYDGYDKSAPVNASVKRQSLPSCGYPVEAFSFLAYPSWSDFFQFPETEEGPAGILERRAIINAKKRLLAKTWHPDKAALTGLPREMLQHISRMVEEMEAKARAEIHQDRRFQYLLQLHESKVADKKRQRALVNIGREKRYLVLRMYIRLNRRFGRELYPDETRDTFFLPAQMAEHYPDEPREEYEEVEDPEDAVMEKMKRRAGG